MQQVAERVQGQIARSRLADSGVTTLVRALVLELQHHPLACSFS